MMKSNFSPQATAEILEKTGQLQELILSVDYENIHPSFQEDLYKLIDKLAYRKD